MTDDIYNKVAELFQTQNLGVLATNLDGHPYTTLVAFAEEKNLKHLLFATSRATRKFANLGQDKSVSLLIDNRQNKADDFHEAMAVTVRGEATEISVNDKPQKLTIYLAKHPSLRNFVRSPNCALFSITVDCFIIVDHFQNVVELRP
ncbi:MAG: hypothetical protein C0616_11250 [Desulfuromonas sp.]|nr:MAG: hypothetical protein C0616_11250 [Desulfuromonas sp.]